MAPKRGGCELGGWASWVSSCWSLAQPGLRPLPPWDLEINARSSLSGCISLWEFPLFVSHSLKSKT